jgi:hypothetical protein
MNDVIHTLQKARVIPILATMFIMWLTYDFHLFYKENALEMKDFQVAGVFAYATTLVACIKFMFEHFSKKIERDEE